ncbi:Hypothetical protein NTJ_00375 [Nesidiocoris tenuis]|uniref:Uncharacterized protein n=1 Tax=Nesidiocoris tenuis TaxID=355587 RepID=A0ABN7A8V0_9HEMI|nr:Hypothetical protein NTJ_00375 [Nesidiocoris tenuis]
MLSAVKALVGAAMVTTDRRNSVAKTNGTLYELSKHDDCLVLVRTSKVQNVENTNMKPRARTSRELFDLARWKASPPTL